MNEYMLKTMSCYKVLKLLGVKDSYFKLEDYKGIIVNKEIVELAIKNDTQSFEKYEGNVNSDKEFLEKVQQSLKLEEENKDNKELRQLVNDYTTICRLNGEGMSSNPGYLSKQLYEDIQKLDNSSLANITSKKLAKSIIENPLYELYAKIYSVKGEWRYNDVTSSLKMMASIKEQMHELISYVQENGFPNKTYKEIVKEQKSKKKQKSISQGIRH